MALKFKKALPPEEKPTEKVLTKKPKKLLKKGDTIIEVDDSCVDKAALTDIQLTSLKSAITSQTEDYNVHLAKAMTYADSDEYGADEKLALHGLQYILKLGPKGKSTKVTADMKKIHKILGDEVFYAVCKVGVTDLKSYLTQDELEDVIEIVQEGSRSKKFVKKV